MSARSYLSIGDVLTLLRQEFPDVTISKIRFLESQGLVNPERTASGYRKFYDDDVERLRWVLRQQREHFLPLKVIKGRLEASQAGSAAAPETAADDAGAAGPVGGHGQVAGTNGRSGDGEPSGEAVAATDGGVPAPVPVVSEPSIPPASLAATGADATASARLPGFAPEEGRDGATGFPAVTGVPPSPRSKGAAVAAGPAGPAAEGGPAAAVVPAAAVAAEGQLAPGTGGAPARPATVPALAAPRVAAGPASGVGPATAGPVGLTAEELAGAAGASVDQVGELVSFGLIEGRSVGGVTYYDDEALTVARLAAAFARFGVEARHLRLHKHAAEREAGLIEQVVLPLVKQRNPEAHQRAADTVRELADLGQGLRATLLRRALRDLIG